MLVVAAAVRRRGEATLRLRGRGRPDPAACVGRPARGAGHRRRSALLLAVPLAVLVLRSLQTPTGWGLDNYRALSGDRREQRAGDAGDRRALATRCARPLLAAALSVLVGVLLSVRARPSPAPSGGAAGRSARWTRW